MCHNLNHIGVDVPENRLFNTKVCIERKKNLLIHFGEKYIYNIAICLWKMEKKKKKQINNSFLSISFTMESALIWTMNIVPVTGHFFKN